MTQEPRWEGRRRAREAALRLLYQMDVAHASVVEAADVEAQVGAADGLALDAESDEYARSLAEGVWARRSEIDGYIGEAALNWRVERLALIDRLVLRLAVHEMTAYRQTPPRVVIDEAIELARRYSGDDAARFVNGVLDGVFRRLKDEGKVVE